MQILEKRSKRSRLANSVYLTVLSHDQHQRNNVELPDWHLL